VPVCTKLPNMSLVSGEKVCFTQTIYDSRLPIPYVASIHSIFLSCVGISAQNIARTDRQVSITR
jgi:hypothetical protein